MVFGVEQLQACNIFCLGVYKSNRAQAVVSVLFTTSLMKYATDCRYDSPRQIMITLKKLLGSTENDYYRTKNIENRLSKNLKMSFVTTYLLRYVELNHIKS